MQFLYVICLANVFFFVVSSNIASVMSSFLTVPRSSVVLIGEKVAIKCNVNGSHSTTWTYNETPIYFGIDIIPSMTARYKIDKRISGQHNLIIDSVDLAHAGRYKCTTAIPKTLWNDIELTVLDSDPVCAANITEVHVNENKQTHLTLWCSINYTGNGFPVFCWTKNNAENIAASTTTSGSSLVPCTNTSSITQQLHANDSGVTFQCRITFKMPSKEDATNVYKYIWNHTLYGPRNLSIVEYADRLECTAEGNPTPAFRWMHVETSRSADGSVLILNGTATLAKDQIFQCTATNVFASERNNFTAKKVSSLLNGTVTSDKDHTFQCTAANIFGTENKNITIQVQGHATDSDVTSGISDFPNRLTVSAIGGSLLFILTIAIIVLCIVRRKRLKDDKSDRPDVALNADLKSYDDIALSSDRSPNNILDGDNLPGSSEGRTIVDNAVYAEVWKPKGPSKGNKGANIGVNSRPPQTQKPERQIVTGADGTVYAELSGMKPPARTGEVPKVSKSPAFSQVEIYAAIDHSGKVPAPPLPQK